MPDELVAGCRKLVAPGETIQGVVTAVKFLLPGPSMVTRSKSLGSQKLKMAIIATNKRYLIHSFGWLPFLGVRVAKRGVEFPRTTRLYLQPCDRAHGDDWFTTTSFGEGSKALYIRRELGDEVAKLEALRPSDQ